MLPACQFLTILTSKSRSRAGVVQILSRSTSKSAPGLPVFNDFDFQIALARRRGANFVDILGNRSFATSVFRTYLCELSKRQNYGKTQHFAQFLPAKTSLLSNIDAARATGNFQYSRKLELLNFLWLENCSFFLARRPLKNPLLWASDCQSPRAYPMEHANWHPWSWKQPTLNAQCMASRKLLLEPCGIELPMRLPWWHGYTMMGTTMEHPTLHHSNHQQEIAVDDPQIGCLECQKPPSHEVDMFNVQCSIPIQLR